MTDPRILHALADLTDQVGRLAAALESQPTAPADDDGQPCCATYGGYMCTRPIGHTGPHQAEDGEGRIRATWPDDTEVRQPTGLTRLLTEPTPAHLPGDIVVRPAQWSVWSEDRSVYYGLATRDDATDMYSTYCGDGAPAADHPSLAAAVAYLIQRRTEDTEDAS